MFFLSFPVQRVPRYSLLLQDLVKHTWNDHRDYNNLKQALQKMDEVANYLNQKKREYDDRDKVVQIEKKLTGQFEVDYFFFE